MAYSESYTDRLGDVHEYLVLESASDVTPEILEAAEQCYDAWFDNGDPIDWDEFWDRLADPNGHNDAGAPAFDILDTAGPAAMKIQRHVRKYRNQS